MRPRTLIAIAVVAGASALVLSTGQCSLNPGGTQVGGLEGSNLVIGRSYKVDDAFAERVGEEIPARFSLILPKRRNDTHRIGVQEMPPGGIVQVNFRTEAGDFRESLYIAPVDVPLLGDMDARLANAGQQLAEQGPLVLSQGFDEVQAIGTPVEISIGSLRAMELTGTYRLRDAGTLVGWRFVIVPHPDKVESLYAVGHVNQEILAIETPEDHKGSLSGKALSTLKLTDLAPAQ